MTKKLERRFFSLLFSETLREADCEGFSECVKAFLSGRRDELVGRQLSYLADQLDVIGAGWYADCADPCRQASALCTEPTALALCASRHPMPGCVVGSVFPQGVDPLDFDGMERQAAGVLQPLRGGEVTVYVTGLTAALVATLNIARVLSVKVHLMHFDRATGEYRRQEVR